MLTLLSVILPLLYGVTQHRRAPGAEFLRLLADGHGCERVMTIWGPQAVGRMSLTDCAYQRAMAGQHHRSKMVVIFLLWSITGGLGSEEYNWYSTLWSCILYHKYSRGIG